MRLFLDDMRRCPSGFVLTRSAEECKLLLDTGEVEVLSLDFDLGPDEPTGLEVARHMVLQGIYPNEIYLHSSSDLGRQQMFQMLYTCRPEGTQLYNHPIPAEKLAQWGQ